MLDLYCERCGPGLLAEPINAVTNLAFLLAAWAAWTLARRAHVLSTAIWSLVGLSVMIGLGSATFHTFATSWARWLDIVPILLFQLDFLWIYLRRVVRIGPSSAAASLAGFLSAALLGRRFPGVLNGSLIYAPAFLVLLVLGLDHFRHRRPERPILLWASGVFSLALLCRSIDEAVCPRFPLGTHFLWHLLNGLLLYLSMRSLIVTVEERSALEGTG